MKRKITPLQILPDFFDVHLKQIKGLSDNTISSYKYAFQLLYEYLYSVKNLRPESVTFAVLEGGTIEQFLLWLETERHCSAATMNQRRAAISTFSKYALKKHFTESMRFGNEVSAIDSKKTTLPQFSYFTAEEITIILAIPSGGRNIERRDKVILSFLYGSGARAQELCDLTVNDIRFGEKTSVRLSGKGNKSRVVIIPDKCSLLLKDYLYRNHLNERDAKGKYLFSSQTHEHMTISCVEAIVKKYVSKAKSLYPDLFYEKNYSPHSFRHSIAVHMLESGIPMPVIKVFLGHASIGTTAIYATVSDALQHKYLKERNVANGFMPKNDTGSRKEYSIKEDLSFLQQR